MVTAFKLNHHVEKRAFGELGRRKSGETGVWEEPTPKKHGDTHRIDQIVVVLESDT